MFNLKLEQAKHALKEGRLDEAGRLLLDPAVADHREALTLASKLAKKLEDRGTQHLQAGRASAALQDARDAHRYGGNEPATQQLMQDALEAQASASLNQSDKKQAVQAAERRLRAGMLSAVGGQLASLDDADAKRLELDIAFRRDAAIHAVAQGQQALKRRAWNQVALCIQQAEQAGGQAKDRAALIDLAGTEAIKDAELHMTDGELEQAAQVLAAIQPVMPDPMPATRLLKAINQLGQAASWLRQGKPQQALPVLQRVVNRCPKAAWLTQLVKQTQQAADAYAQIDASPLGELGVVDIGRLSSVGFTPKAEESAPAMFAETQAVASPLTGGPGGSTDSWGIEGDKVAGGGDHALKELTDRVYVLETQNAETTWLTLGDRVSMGPISGKQPVDLGLVADPLLPVVNLVCEEGDWFIQSDRAVSINDKSVTRALLQHGDKIALSPRCRLKFARPHAASASATLELLQGRLARPDIRRIVLVSDALVIGNTSATHIASSDALTPVVLRLKKSGSGHSLCLGSDQVAIAGDVSVSKGDAVPIAKPVNIGGLGLRLTAIS